MTTAADIAVADKQEFVSFFFRKIAQYKFPDIGKGMAYQFKTPGVSELFKMLEHVLVNYESAGMCALWRIFSDFQNNRLQRTFQRREHFGLGGNFRINVRISSEGVTFPAYDIPFEAYMFIKKYRDPQKFPSPFLSLARRNIILKDIVLFTAMTRFGATVGKPEDTEDEWEVAKDVILLLVWFTRKIDREEYNFIERTLEVNIKWNFNSESRKRLYLLFLDLAYVFFNEDPRRVEHYRECHQRLFESIPDPRIGSREIRDYLFKLMWPVRPNTFLAIQSIVERYERLFPDSDRPLSPRSLMHLCRCQVRENLRDTGNFLYHADRLKVPQRFKKYIMLESSSPYLDSLFAEYGKWCSIALV